MSQPFARRVKRAGEDYMQMLYGACRAKADLAGAALRIQELIKVNSWDHRVYLHEGAARCELRDLHTNSVLAVVEVAE